MEFILEHRAYSILSERERIFEYMVGLILSELNSIRCCLKNDENELI